MIKIRTHKSEVTLNFGKDDILYFEDVNDDKYKITIRLRPVDLKVNYPTIPTFKLRLKNGFKISTWNIFGVVEWKLFDCIEDFDYDESNQFLIDENQKLYDHIKELLK
jgi:hypothetical protein